MKGVHHTLHLWDITQGDLGHEWRPHLVLTEILLSEICGRENTHAGTTTLVLLLMVNGIIVKMLRRTTARATAVWGFSMSTQETNPSTEGRIFYTKLREVSTEFLC